MLRLFYCICCFFLLSISSTQALYWSNAHTQKIDFSDNIVSPTLKLKRVSVHPEENQILRQNRFKKIIEENTLRGSSPTQADFQPIPLYDEVTNFLIANRGQTRFDTLREIWSTDFSQRNQKKFFIMWDAYRCRTSDVFPQEAAFDIARCDPLDQNKNLHRNTTTRVEYHFSLQGTSSATIRIFPITEENLSFQWREPAIILTDPALEYYDMQVQIRKKWWKSVNYSYVEDISVSPISKKYQVMQYSLGESQSIAFLPYYEIQFEWNTGDYEMSLTYDSYTYNWWPSSGYKYTFLQPGTQTQYYGDERFTKRILGDVPASQFSVQ